MQAGKERAVELNAQDARQRMLAAQRWAAAARAAKLGGLPPPPPPARPMPATDEWHPSYALDVTARRFRTHAAATTPASVRLSDVAADGAPTSGEAIAAWGRSVLVAWNDGSHMACAWSTDGGGTFTRGAVPVPDGWTSWRDPAIAVDEKTGVFTLCGLVDPTPGTNGIGAVWVTFSGETPTWGPPTLARAVDATTAALDRPCLVADSTSGSLYLTCTTFGGDGNRIDFQKSTNHGRTWSPATRISSLADAGRVSAPRAAVGPDGDLYVAWMAIGSGAEDHLRLRRSMDHGATWDAELTVAATHLNFGTGSPGVGTARGTDDPSIAVDRTTGLQRGRVHVVWTESVDPYDDALDTLEPLIEREGNNATGMATRFVPGQMLRGALGETGDTDYFAFTATAGANYRFECDSIPGSLYTMRVLCAEDTLTRLAFAGDVVAPAGGGGYITWTAPATGRYYLRIAHVGGASAGYRISTGTAGVGLERARDARDVFASYADQGIGWSTPARVCDAPARFGETQPEVQVAADGMPYVTWLDWRDAECGGRSHHYINRSSDGGKTWEQSQRFSDVQGDWAGIPGGGSAAETGPRGQLSADRRYLRSVWPDGRAGHPGVVTARVDTWFGVTTCQGDLSAVSGSSVTPGWTVTNLNPLFANAYGWRLTGERDWPRGQFGTMQAAADGAGEIEPTIAIPDSAAPGVNRMCLVVTDPMGIRSRECCFDLTVLPGSKNVPVMASEFDLRAGETDRATRQTRIDYRIPYRGAVRVGIYGLRGELVRTLADGTRPAGPSSATWDGRDERGGRAGAGPYFARLEGFGGVKVQRLIWVR